MARIKVVKGPDFPDGILFVTYQVTNREGNWMDICTLSTSVAARVVKELTLQGRKQGKTYRFVTAIR